VLTINEIFHSIQGESTYAGRPCVCVRLTACDLRCRWCDTPYAFHEGHKQSVDEVVAAVELHEDPWDMNVHAVRRGETLAAEGHYAHVPSMLEDVRAGRPTEIDFITGALVREAAAHGVPVPLHTAMYRLVRARERQ